MKDYQDFQLNNGHSVDDILAEFSFGSDSRFAAGPAKHSPDEDEDIKVYLPASEKKAAAAPAEDEFNPDSFQIDWSSHTLTESLIKDVDFFTDYEPDSPYDYTPMMEDASPYDFTPDYISEDKYSYGNVMPKARGSIASMEDEARRIAAGIQAEDDYGPADEEYTSRDIFDYADDLPELDDDYDYSPAEDYPEDDFPQKKSGKKKFGLSFGRKNKADKKKKTSRSFVSYDDEYSGEADEYREEYRDDNHSASPQEYAGDYSEPQPDYQPGEEYRHYSREEIDQSFDDIVSRFGSYDEDAVSEDYASESVDKGFYEEPAHYYHESGNYEYGVDLGEDADPTSYSREDYRGSYVPSGADDVEIDSRFNLSGRKKAGRMSYGGSAVDLSADDGYAPAAQTGYIPSQWTPDYDDPLVDTSNAEQPQRKKHKYLFGKKKKQQQAAQNVEYDPYGGTSPTGDDDVRGFDDNDAAPGDYADYDDYAESKHYEEEEMYFPPTFREYVLSIFASVFLRVRGNVRGDTVGTMEDVEEDLGTELSPSAASKYYGSFIKSLKLRLRISLVLLAVLVYVSVGLPVFGMLKTMPVTAAFCFALQSAIMLMALDVVTTGTLNIFRLKLGADSLAVISCLLTGLDALLVALGGTAALHIPLCAVSSLSVVALLLASYIHARGLRKSLRVPAIGKRFFAVTSELKLKNQELTLLKSLRSYNGFVRRSEEAGPDETVFVKLGIPMLFVGILLAVITAAVKNSYSDFVFILSAIIAPAVPCTALIAYSLPFFIGSSRIFKYGGAIAGWSGLCDIGSSRNIIVTDRDLFPESAITMESVRIFADEDAQKVISYAGSMMQASGACSAQCFMELMEENDCLPAQVDGFSFLPGGGMTGIIEGHKVLCGSTDLMRLMNVRIPFRLTDKTTVLLAIDGILYGIFSLHYEPLPQVRRALVELVRSSRHPVFAVRDFNITPEMLHNVFDIPTDGYDFPPYAERFDLSAPTDDAKTRNIAAVICNEGLGPLTSVADVGRRMYVAVRSNVTISVISAVFGMFFVFTKLIGAGFISISTLLAYMLIWAIPVVLISWYVNLKN